MTKILSPELSKKFKQLTPTQNKRYKAIRWLLNPMGERRSGRTHIMALAFIELSLGHDMWVSIFDHDRSYTASKILLGHISNIVSSLDDLWMSVRYDENNIKIRVKRRISKCSKIKTEK